MEQRGITKVKVTELGEQLKSWIEIDEFNLTLRFYI